MPERNGLDILSDLKNIRPELRVLVLSMHSEDQYGQRALNAGALGYLRKESAPEELILAIRKIVAGGRYVSAAGQTNLRRNWRETHEDSHATHYRQENFKFCA